VAVLVLVVLGRRGLHGGDGADRGGLGACAFGGRRRGSARAAPISARLSDSVAPLVQTISSARAPMASASCSRATCTADAAR
jgi:hypothetical protein